MFNKFMNNYYFGKSGKGDFTPDDLPQNRWQLLLETLRVRFSALIRLNLIYMLVWLPAMIVLLFGSMTALQTLNLYDMEGTGKVILESTDDQGNVVTVEQEGLSAQQVNDQLTGLATWMLILLVPCIAITGPCTAGVSYVTRNWSRDEHAFIWSDFKDAVKENWKQSLLVSAITSVAPLVVYMCWQFYGDLAVNQPVMGVPQMLVAMLGVIWALAVTYAHPMIVGYHLRLRDLFRNSLLLAVARLPMSVGIRLLHCVPVVLGAAIGILFNVVPQALMVLFLYYMLIGFSLSRFITASYCNGVFDKYINSRIEGAKVNRGLSETAGQDDEDEEEEEDEE